MNPKLIVIAGPFQGSVFDLPEDDDAIGRDATNHVRLIDLPSRAVTPSSRGRRRCLPFSSTTRSL